MKAENSQYAINDYIHIEGNYYIHETRVIVIQNNKIVYDGELKVNARIETNDSYVEIIWNDDEDLIFYGRYNGKYDNTDIEFDDGKLIIHGINRHEQPISITIY